MGVAGSAFCFTVGNAMQELKRFMKPDVYAAVNAIVLTELAKYKNKSVTPPASFNNFVSGLPGINADWSKNENLLLADAALHVRFDAGNTAFLRVL